MDVTLPVVGYWGNLGTRYVLPCLVGDALHLRGISASLFPLFVSYGLIMRRERNARDRNAGTSRTTTSCAIVRIRKVLDIYRVYSIYACLAATCELIISDIYIGREIAEITDNMTCRA